MRLHRSHRASRHWRGLRVERLSPCYGGGVHLVAGRLSSVVMGFETVVGYVLVGPRGLRRVYIR